MASLRGMSTKEKLLSIVDDVEMIVKELLETTIAPKPEKLSHTDTSNLITLLMSKNDEFKSTLTLATEQQEIDQKMIQLSGEVARHDNDIQMLQKHLKEADTILSTALFQARQKLEQIQKAQVHQVGDQDLIRFAHRISSTNAVAAPATWQPGDPRRPYPDDICMRSGLLARINDTPISQVLDSLHPPTPSLNQRDHGSTPYSQNFHSTPWYSTTSDIPPASMSATSMFSHSSMQNNEPVRGASNNTEFETENSFVELMSSDSSSSSSSDSQ